MAVGVSIVEELPVVVEEQPQVTRALHIYAVEEDIEQAAGGLGHAGVAGDAEQRRVCLDDVEVGIHGLGGIGVLLAQTHILDGLPVAGGGLAVAAARGVEAMGLDAVEEVHGHAQRLGVARRAIKLGHAVDGESDGVKLLFGVERAAVGTQAPVYTAVLLVDEARGDVVKGGHRRAEILGAAKSIVCRRESPEDTGIEDGAARGGVVEAVRRSRRRCRASAPSSRAGCTSGDCRSASRQIGVGLAGS